MLDSVTSDYIRLSRVMSRCIMLRNVRSGNFVLRGLAQVMSGSFGLCQNISGQVMFVQIRRGYGWLGQVSSG
jgi:hypothetical protein